MSKRGRPKLNAEIPMTWFCLVEAERDVPPNRIRSSLASERRGVDPACKRVSQHFADRFGRIIKWGTIKRQYWAAAALLDTRAGKAEADRVLVDIRARRDAAGWDIEPLKLLGWTDDELLRLLPPDVEIRVRRARLKKLEVASAEAKAKIAELQAERDRVQAELNRLVGGKLN
jgi:hypothetical protein